MTKKKILKEITLNEISAVDKPAQAPAKMVIMKRAVKDAVQEIGKSHMKKNEEFTDMISGIKDRAGLMAVLGLLTDQLWSERYDIEQDLVNKIKELGIDISNDDEIISIFEKRAGNSANLLEALNMATENPKGGDVAADLTQEIETLKKSLELSQKFGQLNDIEKAYYDGLTEENRDIFLGKSVDERMKEIEKSKVGVTTLYKSLDGVEFTSKDDPRLIELAKQNDETRKELALAKAEQGRIKLEKRAEDELNFLPGSLEARCELLKAVDTIKDDAIRVEVMNILKSKNSVMQYAFSDRGVSIAKNTHGMSDKEEAHARLTKRATEIAKEQGVRFEKGYSIACEELPDVAAVAIGTTV